jgi:hypothetical protein
VSVFLLMVPLARAVADTDNIHRPLVQCSAVQCSALHCTAVADTDNSHRSQHI